MTDYENTTDSESDQTTYSLDDENQLSAEDTLVDRGTEDALDEGYSPPENSRGVDAFGTTVEEQQQGETIDQRIEQEVPDPATAYGAPENESGLDTEKVGGDDPDAIDAEQDFLGDPEVGDERAGRLVAEDEGVDTDVEKDLVADDAGIAGSAASAEEAAVHVVDGDTGQE